MQDLVTMNEIADRIGVSIATIRQWRYNRSYLEFPQPDIKGPGRNDQPYWNWSTIEAWINSHRPDLKDHGS